MVEYIRPRVLPLRRDLTFPPYTQLSGILHTREFSCNPPHKVLMPRRRVLRISKRPEPVQNCPVSLMRQARIIELQSVTPSYSKKAPRGATLGARSDPKHRQVGLIPMQKMPRESRLMAAGDMESSSIMT
jgi:hypothetical protein